MTLMFRQIAFLLCLLGLYTGSYAQGWPDNYKGVMLQGFYWDSFDDTKWVNLESQADELAEFFSLVWVPQSANCGGLSMGYDDLYWFDDYNSSFGTESQLRSMISTFKQKGIGTIADVVINHRKNVSNWVDFPRETYKGVAYQLLPSDICKDDDEGNTAAWAAENGCTLGANNDSGEGWDGMRDLDHHSPNVQKNVEAYLDKLLNDFHYAGFRYDMVKGYSPEFTALYNGKARPEFSVGEYWDGDVGKLKAWLDGTKVEGVIQSAVFDFALKYKLRDCCNQGSGWNALGSGSLVMEPAYKRYSVTFVDNHDTFGREDKGSETTSNILAANAFILAAPGTPCVFLPHWKPYKANIKQMIYARQMAGIGNQSSIYNLSKSTSQYAIKVSGTDGNKSVVVVMGDGTLPNGFDVDDYFLIDRGENYAYYLSRSVESAWANVPSGSYDNALSVTLNAVSTVPDAMIVYTTDGSQPTPDDKKVADGTAVDMGEGTTVLKAGILVNGVVKGVITRKYTVKRFEPYDITVYVNTDKVGWKPVNFWTWGGDGSHTPATPNWPGDTVTATATIDGKDWYSKTFRMNSSDDCVNLVFSTGDGSPQTVDVTDVNRTGFFEISSTMNGVKNTVVDVTDQHSTGINEVTADDGSGAKNMLRVYSIDGTLVRSLASGTSIDDALSRLPKGVYVAGGKKYVVRQ